MKDVLKGIVLVVFLWILDTFIAFVPFGPDSTTEYVIATWLVVDAVVVWLFVKRGWLNWRGGLSALIFFALVIGLYFVPLSSDVPQGMEEYNYAVSVMHEDRYRYAEELFWLMMQRNWTSETRQYLLEPHTVFFIKDPGYFWDRDGYVPSHIQADMYRVMLLHSGRFSEEEVYMHTGWCANSFHGMTVVEHPSQRIYADFWAADHFDGYGWGQYTPRPCEELAGKAFILNASG